MNVAIELCCTTNIHAHNSKCGIIAVIDVMSNNSQMGRWPPIAIAIKDIIVNNSTSLQEFCVACWSKVLEATV